MIAIALYSALILALVGMITVVYSSRRLIIEWWRILMLKLRWRPPKLTKTPRMRRIE